MSNIAEAIKTYAELKDRIEVLNLELGKLRNYIIETNPTHGATFEAPPYEASLSFIMGPDIVHRRALYSMISKTHLIQHNVITPGSSYWRLHVRRKA